MSEVILIMGYPAAGKSEHALALEKKGYVRLNRDEAGGKVEDLVPKMEAALKSKKKVVLDNLFGTAEGRKPFLEAAKRLKAPVVCKWIATSLEEAQINALHRMFERHQRVFFTQKDFKGIKDPNLFGVGALFKYRKDFQKPTTAEGFEKIEKLDFARRPRRGYKNKAVIFDYDGTLRVTKGGNGKYPVKPSEVELMPGRKAVVARYKKDGYILLGASNQSGVAKKHLSKEDADACFQQTNKLVGQDIEFMYCPHNVPPKCYCRKPQSGMGVHFIEKYKLDPSQTIMVGDQTTNKTFGTRLGFEYVDQGDFFK